MGYYIIAIVVVLLVLWFITTQKSLVTRDEMCSNSLSQITVQQSSRWDALTAIGKQVKKYSDHEYQTLMDVIGKRANLGANDDVSKINEQENLITNAVSKIIALGESYPELKADTLYIQSMDSINKYEDNVRKARMVYNDCVTRFNALVRGLPSSIVANYLNFKTKEYLKEEFGKTDMPEM